MKFRTFLLNILKPDDPYQFYRSFNKSIERNYINENIRCKCGSNEIIKVGHRYNKFTRPQRFECLKCNIRFTNPPRFPIPREELVQKIIELARQSISTRTIAKKLKEEQIKMSHANVSKIIKQQLGSRKKPVNKLDRTIFRNFKSFWIHMKVSDVKPLKIKDDVICQCGSNNTVKNGLRKIQIGYIQKYHCKTCNRKFSERGIFSKMKTDPAIIKQGLQLRTNGLSLRKTASLLYKTKNVRLSHATIHYWTKKFSGQLE